MLTSITEIPAPTSIPPHGTPDLDLIWDTPWAPKTGWAFHGSFDAGPSSEVSCEACARRIRYVHRISHAAWPVIAKTGCVCVDNLTGDKEERVRRERVLKKTRAARVAEALRALRKPIDAEIAVLDALTLSRRSIRNDDGDLRGWMVQRNGNIRGRFRSLDLFVFKRKKDGQWGFSVDGEFASGTEPTMMKLLRRVADIVYPPREFEEATLRLKILRTKLDNLHVPETMIGRVELNT